MGKRSGGSYQARLKRWEDRRHAIRRLRDIGWTLERIGDRYGVTRQRIKKIVDTEG